MAATAAELADLTILHQIGLARFSVTASRRILKTLRLLQNDLERQVRADAPTLVNDTPSPTSLRLRKLLDQAAATQAEAHRAIRGEIDRDFTGLAEVEAAFANRAARFAVGTSPALATVSAEQLRSAVFSNPMQGKSLRDWTLDMEAGDKRRIREQITIGYLEGESVAQMARRVQGASGVTARGAEMLVRTSVTHINARATAEIAKANPLLFEEYQWLSVLDNRTTPVCQARAGKVYRVGNGPLPPAHPNCRSSVMNLVIGMDPYPDLGFNDWLGRQSAAAQDDVLGPSRGALFRRGGLRVERFVDSTGRRLTLAELRARDDDLFRRAGLE